MRNILLTTALVLPMSGFAFAQTTVVPADEASTNTDAATISTDSATSDAPMATDAATTDAAPMDATTATDPAIDPGAADGTVTTNDASSDPSMDGTAVDTTSGTMPADATAVVPVETTTETVTTETTTDAVVVDGAETDQAALESKMANSDMIARDQAVNELRVDWVNGTNVVSPEGETVGQVRDLIVEAADGKMIAAIIGVGGFLGIGEKQIAVPWDKLAVNYDAQEITTELTKEEAKAAPSYVFRDRESAPSAAPMTDPAMDTNTVVDPVATDTVVEPASDGTAVIETEKEQMEVPADASTTVVEPAPAN